MWMILDKNNHIKNEIEESVKIKQKILKNLQIIIDISNTITKVLRNGGTVYFFGNGGSAADAQHVAAEFVGKFNKDRRPLAAEALTTNTSILTAIANDYSFDEIFSRQVKAKVTKLDLVVGISTSGNSKNILMGLNSAKEIGANTIGFTGKNSKHMKEICDITFEICSEKTARIQEAHILVWHIVCDLVEDEIFGKNS